MCSPDALQYTACGSDATPQLSTHVEDCGGTRLQRQPMQAPKSTAESRGAWEGPQRQEHSEEGGVANPVTPMTTVY
eukprot:NODE_17117_length_960_cov_7.894358.p3 GENE.NODE_17117_length_960_cov_7.894358~~NODE_17117_length_960_cov_7.894358.p3  ORF type:complete len:76 (-),score=6.57 NODE_17117_length_960_cov_7.894358:335-562(-)